MGKRGYVPWERVRPLPRGFKRSVCEWVTGVGWVYNPGSKRYIA